MKFNNEFSPVENVEKFTEGLTTAKGSVREVSANTVAAASVKTEFTGYTVENIPSRKGEGNQENVDGSNCVALGFLNLNHVGGSSTAGGRKIHVSEEATLKASNEMSDLG